MVSRPMVAIRGQASIHALKADIERMEAIHSQRATVAPAPYVLPAGNSIAVQQLAACLMVAKSDRTRQCPGNRHPAHPTTNRPNDAC